MIALNVNSVVYQAAFAAKEAEMRKAVRLLMDKTGEGCGFLGWLDLPADSADIQRDLLLTASKLRAISDCVVVVGIGGSYLGAKAVISALQNDFSKEKPQIIYAGHHLSEGYLADLLDYLNDVSYSVIVISKSGTTTEPAVAFRLLKNHCEQKYGKESSKERIVCITDKEKGALKSLADKENYTSYIIADDVGGRYSVLSPVGLLPIAVAGLDIGQLLAGAKSMRTQLLSTDENIAVQYAVCRNYFLQKGFNVEVLASFEPDLQYFIEWWKQLFGESEGKNGKGIFPTGLIYTTDLHSMGQYMQDGQRFLFETFLSVKQSKRSCIIPYDAENQDDLNYIADKNIHQVNQAAEQATMLAHKQGGVPIMQLEMNQLNEYALGELIYFFEYACAVSAYMLGVNPFDQPGVEAYKNNMFALLGKGG
ncbi:MAG: glucose-6-phosphate isomerase [Lentimicrobiaceae bacterium]|nr:glucose-6-phosphate isomerase [Lentimicrobiaceae bacterium]